MKAFKVIYKHGHFIDVETQQRLIPVQGAEYTISSTDKAFKTEDAKMKIGESLNSNDKAAWAEDKFGKSNYGIIMVAGEQLFFRVGNSRKVDGDENREYIFICTLLENLYLYLREGKKGDEEAHWRLAECKCTLEYCLHGGLTLTEKIPAKSLNALFSNTVQFYFSLQRSGSANSFNTFFRYKKGMNITLDDAKLKRYKGLSEEREAFVKNITGSI